MVLWLGYVKSDRRQYDSTHQVLLDLRPWVVFQGLFALAAFMANWRAFRARTGTRFSEAYERSQRADRIASGLSGLALLALAVLVVAEPDTMTLPVAWAAVIGPALGMAKALINEDRAVRSLLGAAGSTANEIRADAARASALNSARRGAQNSESAAAYRASSPVAPLRARKSPGLVQMLAILCGCIARDGCQRWWSPR